MRISAAIVILLLTVVTAFAAETLPLGAGSACVLVSEHDTRATLDCVDDVQVGRDGSGTVLGRACGGLRPTATGAVPPVVNLSGSWTTSISTLGTCATDVAQDGEDITITADRALGPFSGRFSGSGTISGELFGSVTHDGQHIDGVVSCLGASLTISADRR